MKNNVCARVLCTNLATGVIPLSLRPGIGVDIPVCEECSRLLSKTYIIISQEFFNDEVAEAVTDEP